MHAFGRDFEDEDDMYDYIDYLIEEGILEEDLATVNNVEAYDEF
jgi:hypothetical protein